ncbi:MAG: 3D domain-containing protein [Acidobacteriota bacterium]|nr:3D domain-containing protein [Acidobacteriota bacterium]
MNKIKMKITYLLLAASVLLLNSSCNSRQQPESVPFDVGTASRNKALADSTPAASEFVCSDGWRVTGYYTPFESDFNSAEREKIKVENVGNLKFNKEFLLEIYNKQECERGGDCGEGWGKTKLGWYLGYYDDKWHKSQAPLDANGNPLSLNSIAVDRNQIPANSKVTVSGIPSPFAERIYTANDVGLSVLGKHVDIYCGEGTQAKQSMYDITRNEEHEWVRVCFKKPD